MAKIEIPNAKILDLQTSRTKSIPSKFRLSRKDWDKVKFPEDKIITKIFEDSGIKITIGDRGDFTLLIYMDQGTKSELKGEALERLEQYMTKNKLL